VECARFIIGRNTKVCDGMFQLPPTSKCRDVDNTKKRNQIQKEKFTALPEHSK
jgi:hypothetical protein